MTSYRRTDEKQVQFSEERPFLMVRWTENLDMLRSIEPADYIEEQWEMSPDKHDGYFPHAVRLLRFRTIRLGINDPPWTLVEKEAK